MIKHSGADKSQPARSHISQDPPDSRHMSKDNPIETAEEKNNLDMIIANIDPVWQQQCPRIRSCAAASTLVVRDIERKWNYNFGHKVDRQELAVQVARHEY